MAGVGRFRELCWALAIGASMNTVASAQTRVTTAAELSNAIAEAEPGTEVVIADGTYELGHRLNASTTGTAAMPVRVRAENRGRAVLRFRSDGSNTVEGFVVTAAHWSIEDLVIEGECADHSRCEHAFHIVGDADFTIVRGNVVRDFNAHIKANGADGGAGRAFPDDVLVEGNELYSATERMTANPVTPIDVVGGRRWVIRGNFIHDFAKAQGNGISYAAFLKGNGRDGIIERNLVVCELLHTGQTRLGLSFGGGGSDPNPICEDMDCSIEHQGGVMRNNIVAHCGADVGIYVNECMGCEIVHNTVFEGAGIDLRFATTSVHVEGNVVSGRIRDRDSATSTRAHNLEMVSAAMFDAMFVDPDGLDFGLEDGTAIVDQGTPRATVPDDYCANARDDGSPDLGAVEYDGDGPCDTTMPGSGGASLVDAGVTPPIDAGDVSRDGGVEPTDGGAPRADASVDAGRALDTSVPGDDGSSADGEGCGCHATRGRAHAVTLLLCIALLRRRRVTRCWA